MYDILIGVGALLIALTIVVVGIVYLFKGKVIYNQKLEKVAVDLPFFGKIRTNVPAIAFCFIGAALTVYVLQWWGHKPETIDFVADVAVDQAHLQQAGVVVVGVTTSPWAQTETPPRPQGTFQVHIPVPKTWPTYTAYAFAHGVSGLRPVAIGVRPDNPEFSIRLDP